jgi:hypothetical protein
MIIISKKQKQRIDELNNWFDGEIVKLKKRTMELMKDYDKKRSFVMQAKVRKKMEKY